MFTGGVHPAQDELSEGAGKVPRSSCAARCSRQLHVYIQLLTQCSREADLILVARVAPTFQVCFTRLIRPWVEGLVFHPCGVFVDFKYASIREE